MYAALWRVLPGPWWFRTLILIFLATVLAIALVMFVFPWVDEQFFAPADPLIDAGVPAETPAGGDGGLAE